MREAIRGGEEIRRAGVAAASTQVRLARQEGGWRSLLLEKSAFFLFLFFFTPTLLCGGEGGFLRQVSELR